MGRTEDGDALEAAVRVGRSAAALGFDWPDVLGPMAKVEEERAELEEALEQGDAGWVEAELGDLLFAVVNVARHAGVDPTQALLGTVGRFEARWGLVRQGLEAEGRQPENVSLEELEARWQAAKRTLSREEGYST